MEEFDFDYHMPTTEYPESGTRLQLGNSYQFAASPTAPDQRLITLNFPSMQNFCDANGNPDVTTMPKINFHRLEQFYLRHKMWKSFNYRHPQYGMLVVRFNKPLKTPKTVASAPGRTEGFSIELVEQP